MMMRSLAVPREFAGFVIVVGTALLAAVGFAAAQSGQPLVFSDITSQAGITFVHHNGASVNKSYPELFGGGVAVLDLDSDGWPDLLFVNGRDWPPGPRAKHGLYRNNRNGTFADVTAGSGLDALESYALGASV